MVNFIDCSTAEPSPLAAYTFPTEPSLIALGGSHIACARGPQVWFFPFSGGAAVRKVYPAPVDALRLGTDLAAAMFQGRAMLHMASIFCFIQMYFKNLPLS